MELIINKKKRIFNEAPASLDKLMEQEVSGKTNGLAVAVNNQVVPRSDWKTTLLQDQDSILIITATQGG